MATEGTYRFKFRGRQARAIGQVTQIYDTYKAKSLGHALFMLFTDYNIVLDLEAFDTSNMMSKFDSFECTRVPDEILKKTEIISFKYPRRETSERTGSYKYYRMDAPVNYNY